MKINVQTPNFVADGKLIQFIEKKLSKLEQFYEDKNFKKSKNLFFIFKKNYVI